MRSHCHLRQYRDTAQILEFAPFNFIHSKRLFSLPTPYEKEEETLANLI